MFITCHIKTAYSCLAEPLEHTTAAINYYNRDNVKWRTPVLDRGLLIIELPSIGNRCPADETVSSCSQRRQLGSVYGEMLD